MQSETSNFYYGRASPSSTLLVKIYGKSLPRFIIILNNYGGHLLPYYFYLRVTEHIQNLNSSLPVYEYILSAHYISCK